MTAGRRLSVTILQLLGQCALSCASRQGAAPAGGERGSRWSRRAPSSSRLRGRAGEPPRAAAAHRAASPRRPGAPAPDGARCSAATACSSGSARAASAWSGAPTTSCCTARSRSSGSRSAPDGRHASGRRREAHATARLAHPAIVALYEACAVERRLLPDLRARPRATRSAQLIAARRARRRAGARDRPRARRRARARPRARRDPPRHQAPERARARPPPSAPSGGARRAAKLTDFGGAQPRRRGRAHAHRRRARHARLHGARAERGPRGRASRPTSTRWRSSSTRRSAASTRCAAPLRRRRPGGSVAPYARWRAYAATCRSSWRARSIERWRARRAPVARWRNCATRSSRRWSTAPRLPARASSRARRNATARRGTPSTH